MFNIHINVDKVMKQLSAYADQVPEKKRRFLEELASVGIDTAAVKFRDAVYDGVNDVTVRGAPEWIGDDTLVISASGRAILFIEFGTGVRYAEPHPMAGEFGMERGKYGKGQGGRKGGWVYKGEPGSNGAQLSNGHVHTYGNPANRAMYDATKEMREQIMEVAGRVFK